MSDDDIEEQYREAQPRARDFLEPEWVKERAQCLTEFLDGGLFSAAQLGGIRDMCNLTLAGSSTAHPMWIKQKAATSPAPADADAVYRAAMAARIGEKLALLPFLDYETAAEEDSLTMLMLSCIQAGVVPLASVDQAHAFFETNAPGPMLTRADVPAPGDVRASLMEGVALPFLSPGWIREAPFLDVIREASSSKVEDFASRFKELTPGEQDALMVAMGIPIPAKPPSVQVQVAQNPTKAPGANSGGSNVGLGAEIAMGLGPLMQQIQASVDSMTTLAKRSVKGDDSDEEESLSGEARLEKLLRFGGAQLHKKKMTLADFQRETETDKIRDAQRIRKVVGSTKYELLWNQAVEEQTVMLVQLEEIGHERLHDTLSKSAKASCAVYEQTVHTQLRGLKERMEIVEECMRLGQRGQQGQDEAEKLFSLYLEKLTNKSENKLLVKLRQEARASVKEDKELVLLEAVARLTKGGLQGAGNTTFGAQQQPAGPGPVGSGGPQPAAKKPKRAAHAQGSYAMSWVDGSYFNASLGGVQAPDPRKFPGFHLARLDSPSGGIVHTPGWLGQCGACGVVGHSHSECPANRWSVGGVEHVNVRWLYAQGFCDAQGERK